MSTTEPPLIGMRRIVLLLFALAGGAVALWLAFSSADGFPEHVSAASETRPAHTPHAASGPAPTGSGSMATERRYGHANAAAPTSAGTDIPPHISWPSDVVVEIGMPIDADNPPLETSAVTAPVTSLGPPLDADVPSSTAENTSTENVSIGDPMPVDEAAY